jgi:DNA mismatch endonuclease, patch repair protein
VSSDSRTTPSYAGLKPASAAASHAHSRSSRSGTRCETRLRAALWAAGYRYRKNVKTLPGKPDIVFPGARLAIFCDGDFWHGRNWMERKSRLALGTNGAYWIRKIETNMARDRRHDLELANGGWRVLRFWEKEISTELPAVIDSIRRSLGAT